MNSLIALVFSFLILHSSFLIPTVKAADSTPSADIETKLKSLQDEIASRAAKIKQEISRKLQNRVFVGFIKSKSETSLTLATTAGTRLVNLNDDTVYKGSSQPRKGAAKVSLKSLATDDYVIALGDIDENEVLTARVVIKSDASESKGRQSVFGQVVSSGDQTITIQDHDGKSTSISTSDETGYKLGKNTGSFGDIKASKPLIAVGEISKSGALQARFIYILPYTAILKPKIATSSASSTPSGKTSPSTKQKK